MRRPVQQVEPGATQSSSSAAAASHGSDAAAAPEPSPENPGKPKRFFKVQSSPTPFRAVLSCALLQLQAVQRSKVAMN